MYEDILARDPCVVWAWVSLAQLHLEQENVDCFQCLHRAIRLDTDNAQLWASLGLAYEAFGKYEAAAKSLVRATALGLESATIQCVLARVECFLGMYEESVERLEKIYSNLDPSSNVSEYELTIFCQVLKIQAEYFFSILHFISYMFRITVKSD